MDLILIDAVKNPSLIAMIEKCPRFQKNVKALSLPQAHTKIKGEWLEELATRHRHHYFFIVNADMDDSLKAVYYYIITKLADKKGTKNVMFIVEGDIENLDFVNSVLAHQAKANGFNFTSKTIEEFSLQPATELAKAFV